MRGSCGKTKTIVIICLCAFTALIGILYLSVRLFTNPPKAIMLPSRMIDESMMEFSPDGTEVGYITWVTYALLYPEAPTRMEEVYFCWRDVKGERGFISVKIYSDRDECKDGISGSGIVRSHFFFSPDSKYACVATVHQLFLVELASGKVSQISYSDERVTSFRWLNSEEIRYVSSGFCWQQKIDKEQKSRKKLCSIESDGSEFWSPKGQYVVYLNVTKSSGYSLDVLNVSSDEVIASIEQPDEVCSLTVAWKQDESEVFCIVRFYGMASRAYLAKLSSGQVIDRSNELNKHFGKNIPKLKPLWTNDGQYVLTDLFWETIGDCLIRPEKWEVVDIESNLPKHVPKNKTSKPRLFRLPFSGWFGVKAMAIDYSSDWKYLVDYEFKHAILLDKRMTVALSPNGKLVAVHYPWGEAIRIREVAIPVER